MVIKIFFLLLLSIPFSLNALTNDGVQKRCQKALSNLPNYDNNPYNSSISQISNLVKDIIKKIPNVENKDLPNTLANCLEGIDAMIWLIEQKQKIEEKSLSAIEESIQIKRSLQKENPAKEKLDKEKSDADVKKNNNQETAKPLTPLIKEQSKDAKKKNA